MSEASTEDKIQEEQEASAVQELVPGLQRNLEEEVVRGFIANIFIYPVVLLYFVCTFAYVTRKVVPYEFIDEKFHINQTLTYLKGHWLQWDPKITTPPGLYILGYVNHRLLRTFIKSWSSLTILRLVNLFGGLVYFPIVVLRPLFLFNAISFWPIALICFPLMSTYYYLYYTDVWSTIFIIQSLSVALTMPLGMKYSIWLSAALGGISCLFRQTNIVWCGFIMLVTVERQAIVHKQFNTHSMNNYLKLFIHSVDEFKTLVFPYFLNFVGFFLYLIWNRSITLGDKSNHTAGIHVMQLLYCFAFLAVFSLPLWFSKNFLRMYRDRFQNKQIQMILEILFIMLMIRYFTKVHPFLLADNRHYTFYLFKRLMNHNRRLIKYGLMAPIYHFCTFVYLEILRPSEMVFDPIIPLPIKDPIQLPVQLTHISWTALILCTIATVVPSPLFEPRYYILPYYFWRLFITCSAEPIWGEVLPALPDEKPVTISSTKRLFLEFCWFWVIDLFTLLVFIRYAFPWQTEQFLQRIIW
ncbi:hypothetical protein RNJ44_01120 [Nakaseomyces bracarensis]|uniref:Dol-P-Glc:Glc(2)Man(9)GlcNAc(2)-PP-Dol alpha-1,2-glucosyltransferase n=1 Tax=Nakaseomyces bracarensis TaxID=273131 RepID=A0ABR4NQZ6_9SACH